MKQTVYIDILIGVNLIINYFLLLVTSKFLYLKFKTSRLILGEILSGIYSLYIFLPDCSAPISLAVKILMAASIVGTVFGFKNFKIFIKSIICFFTTCFAFSGIMFALWYIFRPHGMVMNNGVVYFNISPIILIVSTLISYMIIEFSNKILERRENKNLICDIFVKLKDKSFKVKAKVDTCNSLKEPFSNLPAVIISKKVVEENFPDFFNYTSSAETFADNGNLKIRFIPFQTVSGDGLFPAFKPEFIKINSNVQKQAYIAVCPDKTLPCEIPALVNPLLID